jgi:hypothetical protein
VDAIVPQYSSPEDHDLGPSVLVKCQYRDRLQTPQPLDHPCDEPDLMEAALGPVVSCPEPVGQPMFAAWSKSFSSARVKSPANLDHEEILDINFAEFEHDEIYHRAFASAPARAGIANATSSQAPPETIEDSDAEMVQPMAAASALSDRREGEENQDEALREVMLFDASDIVALHASEGPIACLPSSFRAVDLSQMLGGSPSAEVECAAIKRRDLIFQEEFDYCDVQWKLPKPADIGFRAMSSDAESHSTASAQLDLEGTDSALSTNSSQECKGTDLESARKDNWDDSVDDTNDAAAASPALLWPHYPHDSHAGALPRRWDSEPEASIPAQVVGDDTEECRRVAPRVKRLVRGNRSSASEIPGPPISPRAPYCAAQGWFQSPGFVFSELDIEPAGEGGSAQG